MSLPQTVTENEIVTETFRIFGETTHESLQKYLKHVEAVKSLHVHTTEFDEKILITKSLIHKTKK